MNQHYRNFKDMVETQKSKGGFDHMLSFTHEQVDELMRLVVEREFPAGHPMAAVTDDRLRTRAMEERLHSAMPNKEEVEGWLNWMRKLPLRRSQQELPVIPESKAGPVIEDGMYILGSTIYKVVVAVHGSGRLYAKELVPPVRKGGRGTFMYAPGAINLLTADDKLTKEKAQEYGAMYGICSRCGATLTAEDSIERMMGPVCFNKMGW